MQIDGQVALVTGGGSGLGEATARHLAAQGAKVAILDFDAGRAADVAKDVDGFACHCDVSDSAQVEVAVASVTAHFGTAARIAVNCAGIGLAARIVGREGKTSIPLFRRVLEVNLFGTYHVMTYAAQAMMEMPELPTTERGVIVSTSSAAFEDGQVGQAAYAASKGAIASMALPAAREFAKMGVRVMNIAPGLFETPMMQSLPEEVTDKIVANIPFPDRLGAPAEFAQLVGDIVGNPYLNGTTIRLDGAVRLPPR